MLVVPFVDIIRTTALRCQLLGWCSFEDRFLVHVRTWHTRTCGYGQMKCIAFARQGDVGSKDRGSGNTLVTSNYKYSLMQNKNSAGVVWWHIIRLVNTGTRPACSSAGRTSIISNSCQSQGRQGVERTELWSNCCTCKVDAAADKSSQLVSCTTGSTSRLQSKAVQSTTATAVCCII